MPTVLPHLHEQTKTAAGYEIVQQVNSTKHSINRQFPHNAAAESHSLYSSTKKGQYLKPEMNIKTYHNHGCHAIDNYNSLVKEPPAKTFLGKYKARMRISSSKNNKQPFTMKSPSRKEKQRSYLIYPKMHSIGLHRVEPPMLHRKQPKSSCTVTFKYLGQIVQLNHKNMDALDEIRVEQQHCGGGNICVYRGQLLPGKKFTFISQRHRGYPFSLTFYLNDIYVERLSTCCEYKHRLGFKLGAKTSHFGFVEIIGGHPCYKCMISTGHFRTFDWMTTEKNCFSKKDMHKNKRPLPQHKERNVCKVEVDEQHVDKQTEPLEDLFEITSVSSLKSINEENGEKSQHYVINNAEPVVEEQSRSRNDSSSEDSTLSVHPKDSMTLSSASQLGDDKQELSSITTADMRTSPLQQQTSFSEKYKTPSLKSTSSDSGDERTKNPKKLKQSSFSSGSNSESSSSLNKDEFIHHLPSSTILKVPVSSMLSQMGTIDLSNFKLTDQQVQELISLLIKSSHSITSVILCNCNLDEKSMGEILKTIASSCTNVKTLNVGQNKGISIENLLQLLENMNVEYLILDDNKIGDDCMRSFMTGMKSLYGGVSSLKPGEISMKVGDDSKDMTVNPSGNEKELYLKCLSMNRVDIDTIGVNAVADFLTVNPPLKTLYLGGLSLSSECFLPLWKVLSSGENNNLKHLNLAGNNVNDKGLERFAALTTKKSVVESFVFCDNLITDEGARYLVDFAQKNKMVKNIYLTQGNKVRQETVKSIEDAISSKR